MADEKTAVGNEEREQEIVKLEDELASEIRARKEASVLWFKCLQDEQKGVRTTLLFGLVSVRIDSAQYNAWDAFAREAPACIERRAAGDDLAAAEGCSDLTYTEKRQKMADARERIRAADVVCREVALKWCAENGISAS